MTKTVSILIDPKDFLTLRPDTGAPYNLCFARKVGDTFNVVWQSADDYGPQNDFSWDPVYQLFATNTFSAGMKVTVSSNKVPIALGQQSTLSKQILLSTPAIDQAPPADPQSIVMVNNYGPIHAGLMAQSTLAGKTVLTPVFVSPDADVSGDVTLTPKEVVQVWFARNVETSTMFEGSVSKVVQIDLTGDDSATRLYKDGKWTTPAPSLRASYATEIDGRLILQIVVAVGGFVTVNNVINSIRNYLLRTAPTVGVSGTYAGNTITLNYSEAPLNSQFARLQLRALADSGTFRQTLIDAAVQALSMEHVSWTDMDVRAPAN